MKYSCHIESSKCSFAEASDLWITFPPKQASYICSHVLLCNLFYMSLPPAFLSFPHFFEERIQHRHNKFFFLTRQFYLERVLENTS